MGGGGRRRTRTPEDATSPAQDRSPPDDAPAAGAAPTTDAGGDLPRTRPLDRTGATALYRTLEHRLVQMMPARWMPCADRGVCIVLAARPRFDTGASMAADQSMGTTNQMLAETTRPHSPSSRFNAVQRRKSAACPEASRTPGARAPAASRSPAPPRGSEAAQPPPGGGTHRTPRARPWSNRAPARD
jgi:hypothetical protein